MTARAPNLLAESGLPIAYPIGPGRRVDRPDIEGHDTATRTIVRSLTVMQKEATVAISSSEGRWRLASDEGPYLAGHDHAPAPLAYMTVGFSTDVMSALTSALAGSGAEHGLWMTLDTFFSMKGSMRARTMTGGASSPSITVHTPAHDSAEVVGAIRRAVAGSVTSALATGTKTSLFSLTNHGRSIPVGRVASAGGTPPRDPGSHAELPAPIGAASDGIVVKTMNVQQNPADAGVSLRERQDRGLHLQAEARRRADGIVAVELRLFSPSGSTFTFLSEEPTAEGARTRAPDSLTYISAGLGFCFMTQIGRFAKIVKEDLGPYHIIQDIGFSRGDSGSPTSVSDPVTHVYLSPTGDEDFSREALDMSEQTCFLHALCRTPLEAEVQVSPV